LIFCINKLQLLFEITNEACNVIKCNEQHLSAFHLYDSLRAEPQLKILDVCFRRMTWTIINVSHTLHLLVISQSSQKS